MAMWNRGAETAGGAELERLRASRLAKTLRRAWTNERYRGIFAAHGVTSADEVKSTADIVRLPFTSAKDLCSDSTPFALLCVDLRELLEIHRSSGGAYSIPYTKGDLLAWAECVARAFSAAGAEKGDLVEIDASGDSFAGGESFETNPSGDFFDGGALGLYHGARKAGLVCFSQARPSNGCVRRSPLNAPAFTCTGGATGGAIRSNRDSSVLRLLGCEASGGIGTIGAECSKHCGFHVWEDMNIVEIVDGRGKTAADGEEGEIVLTTLCREAQPLVRFRTGMFARVISREKCACGRTSPRISVR